MITKIETQARKKPKLNRLMDILDLQLLLLTGLVIPYAIWLVTGISAYYTEIGFVIYLVWMIIFKVDKPSGYFSHWLSYKVRGVAWTAYGNNEAKECYRNLRIAKKINK